jgi:hypothetical protein
LALTPTQDPMNKRAGGDEAFLREVEEAVRASDLANFWKRYGRWLVALLALGLAAFGGWIYYQNQQRAEDEKQSEVFVDAMDKLETGKEADEKAALVKLKALTTARQPGYRAMAQIVMANITAEKGDLKNAAAAYGKVANDESLPQPFRDLALIRQTTAEFDTLEPQKIVDRLKPLATPGNPWFGSAGEMTAIAYKNMGKANLAGPIFAQIAKQEGLPESLRDRSRQMAGALGIDAVQLEEKKDKASGAAKAPAKGETK